MAVHDLTETNVAVKILNRKKLDKVRALPVQAVPSTVPTSPSLPPQLDMGAKVRTEIEILKSFRHPHIIRL